MVRPELLVIYSGQIFFGFGESFLIGCIKEFRRMVGISSGGIG